VTSGKQEQQSSSPPPGNGDGAAKAPLFDGYKPIDGAYDEVFTSAGSPRPGVESIVGLLDGIGRDDYVRRQHLADVAFLKGGITFNVYSDEARGVERIFPFDLVPRLVTADDWEVVERGLVQRVTALNLFLADIYGDQRCIDEGVLPRPVLERCDGYLPKMRGIKPPGGVYTVISGIDLVRGPDGRFIVLEDNVRTPSGVSYVLENRAIMKRVLPRVFTESQVRSVDEYPTRLTDTLGELSPVSDEDTVAVVLTPGPFNSAYFEHTFLARRMGIELVQPNDLFVHRERVYMKTTQGAQQVHVIYRRIDDDFLDPKVFREDSLLGVPGIVSAYAAGNVTLANAIGNGVADDKAIYPYLPALIEFYLSEKPILGQVDTLVCARDEHRKRVLGDLSRMVVKEVDASGGYGMLIGPKASRAQLDEFDSKIRDKPTKYIAQPLVELSTVPTWVDGTIGPRRVDLRPYIITGKTPWVLPGGLTRVALVAGSYVVNSSQGGGSKDTWVLEA